MMINSAVLGVIRGECERQHVGEDRMWFLLDAFTRAFSYYEQGVRPSLENVLELANRL